MKKTILVVDDEAGIVYMLENLLQADGYEVFGAVSTEKALALCAKAELKIDLVISDHDMPNLNGKQLSQELRLRRPDLEVIFMSGNPEVCERLVAEGSVCLAKPFDVGDLRSAITAACDRR